MAPLEQREISLEQRGDGHRDAILDVELESDHEHDRDLDPAFQFRLRPREGLRGPPPFATPIVLVLHYRVGTAILAVAEADYERDDTTALTSRSAFESVPRIDSDMTRGSHPPEISFVRLGRRHGCLLRTDRTELVI